MASTNGGRDQRRIRCRTVGQDRILSKQVANLSHRDYRHVNSNFQRQLRDTQLFSQSVLQPPVSSLQPLSP